MASLTEDFRAADGAGGARPATPADVLLEMCRRLRSEGQSETEADVLVYYNALPLLVGVPRRGDGWTTRLRDEALTQRLLDSLKIGATAGPGAANVGATAQGWTERDALGRSNAELGRLRWWWSFPTVRQIPRTEANAGWWDAHVSPDRPRQPDEPSFCAYLAGISGTPLVQRECPICLTSFPNAVYDALLRNFRSFSDEFVGDRTALDSAYDAHLERPEVAERLEAELAAEIERLRPTLLPSDVRSLRPVADYYQEWKDNPPAWRGGLVATGVVPAGDRESPETIRCGQFIHLGCVRSLCTRRPPGSAGASVPRLPGVEQEGESLVQFTCPSCRGTVTEVAVITPGVEGEQTRCLTESVDVSTVLYNDRWGSELILADGTAGPYRLRPGQLVWWYGGGQPGGFYAGSLGILRTQTFGNTSLLSVEPVLPDVLSRDYLFRPRPEAIYDVNFLIDHGIPDRNTGGQGMLDTENACLQDALRFRPRNYRRRHEALEQRYAALARQLSDPREVERILALLRDATRPVSHIWEFTRGEFRPSAEVLFYDWIVPNLGIGDCGPDGCLPRLPLEDVPEVSEQDVRAVQEEAHRRRPDLISEDEIDMYLRWARGLRRGDETLVPRYRMGDATHVDDRGELVLASARSLGLLVGEEAEYLPTCTGLVLAPGMVWNPPIRSAAPATIPFGFSTGVKRRREEPPLPASRAPRLASGVRTVSPLVSPRSLATPSVAPPSFGPPSFGPPSFTPPSSAPPSFGPPSFAPPSFGPPSFGPPSSLPTVPRLVPSTGVPARGAITTTAPVAKRARVEEVLPDWARALGFTTGGQVERAANALEGQVYLRERLPGEAERYVYLYVPDFYGNYDDPERLAALARAAEQGRAVTVFPSDVPRIATVEVTGQPLLTDRDVQRINLGEGRARLPLYTLNPEALLRLYPIGTTGESRRVVDNQHLGYVRDILRQ